MLYGAHISSAGGISTAIDRAEELGCDAVQVFTQSPRMWRPTEHSDEQVARFRERRQEARIKAVVCHALYLVNLAGADRDLLGGSHGLAVTDHLGRQVVVEVLTPFQIRRSEQSGGRGLPGRAAVNYQLGVGREADDQGGRGGRRSGLALPVLFVVAPLLGSGNGLGGRHRRRGG